MSPEVENAFKADGRRLTHQRRRIVEQLENSGKLISAEQVQERLKHDHPEMGLSTVYRTLELLLTLGLAHKKSFGEGYCLYELRGGRTRQHAHCRACGSVIEFDEALSDYLALQLERDLGFVADTCELTLHGLCPSCSTREPALKMTL